MLSGSVQKMSRERLREIKKKDDISDTHKSTDQSRPTVVVGIKSSFYQIWYIDFSLTLNCLIFLRRQVGKTRHEGSSW